jgi:hypothetical protein
LKEKVKKPFYKQVWFWALIVVIIIGGALRNQDEKEGETAAVDPSPTEQATKAPEPTSTEAPATEAPATEAPVSAPADWQTVVKEIAANGDTSKTEKADAVAIIAKNYQLTQTEAFEFAHFMIDELAKDNYLADPENDEYMLSSIFRAVAVEHLIDDAEQLPLDAFAFDFLQNVKYVYRGVETPESESVQANERQMQKSAIEIQKALDSLQ